MSHQTKQYQVPTGWGLDPLTGYLDQVVKNQQATLVKKRDYFDKLARIDKCFERVLDGSIHQDQTYTHLFMYRCHGAFRAASGHAMAGVSAEMFPVLRTCIEWAGYAHVAHQSDELAVSWMDRNESLENKRTVRKAFNHAKVKELLLAKDQKLWSIYDEVYELTIDQGAHPNQMAVKGSLEVEDQERDDMDRFYSIYVHGDEETIDFCLNCAIRAGALALHIFQHLYAARFELLGVKHDLIKMRMMLNA